MSDELEDDGHIRVICRVRPENAKERKLSSGSCIRVAEDEATMSLESKTDQKSFCFDYSANDAVTQEEIFERVGLPITTRCVDGYNGTILCYGQTGSGKTYTMFGSSPGVVRKTLDNSSDRGLVPRVLEYLWMTIGEDTSYKFSCSFYEIYQEKIFDLLDISNSSNPQNMGLSVREDVALGVYVEGCSEEKVNSLEDASRVLFQGYRNRHVSETSMNRQSSRSHAVFQLHIEHTERNISTGVNRIIQSRFSMVDLAGSERQSGTQATGTRLKEANTINKSLTCLGRVINELISTPNARGKRKRHINYRDSKLTFLLRDSLGGNSKTALIAAVSPAESCFNETLSTLYFAQRCMGVMNSARVNETTTGTMVALQAEIAQLRAQIESLSKRSSIVSRRSTSNSPNSLLDNRRRLSANRSLFPTSPVTTADKKNILSTLSGHISSDQRPVPLSPKQQGHLNRLSGDRVSVESSNTCGSTKSDGLSFGKENSGPTRVLMTPPATQVKVSKLIEDNTLLLRINRELEDALEERENVIDIKEKEVASLSDELESTKYELEVALETSNGRFSHTKILLGTLHELKAENESLSMEVQTLRFAKDSLTEMAENEKRIRLDMLNQLESLQYQCDTLQLHNIHPDDDSTVEKKRRSSHSARESMVSETEDLILQLKATEEQCYEQADLIAALQEDLTKANDRIIDLEGQLSQGQLPWSDEDKTVKASHDLEVRIHKLEHDLAEANSKVYSLEGQLSLMTHKYMDELNRADNLLMSLGALKINLKRSESINSMSHKESNASSLTLDSGTVFACLAEEDREIASPRKISYRHGSVIISRSNIGSSPFLKETKSHLRDNVDTGTLRFSRCTDDTVERDLDSSCSSETDVQSFGSADTFDTEVKSNHSSNTHKTSETVVIEDDASETVVKDEERWSATIVKGNSPNRLPITSYIRPSRNVVVKATSTASSLTWHDSQARPSLDDPEEVEELTGGSLAEEGAEEHTLKKRKKITFLKKLKRNVGGLFGKKQEPALANKKGSTNDSFTDPCKHPPPAPSNFKVEFKDGLPTSNEVILSWQIMPQATNGDNFVGSQALLDLCRFEVQQCVKYAELGSFPFADIGTAETTEFTTSVADFPASIIYYRVRAISMGVKGRWSDLVSIKTLPRTSKPTLHRELQYEAPFDENGVLYWLGTQGGEKEYTNPLLTGQVQVQMSSKWYASDAAIYVEHNPGLPPQYDKEQPCSWIQVDLGPERQLVPNYYCLRGYDKMKKILKSWELQARSTRDDPWTTLKRHFKDKKLELSGPLAVASWPLENITQPYRYFRIIQLDHFGKTSKNLCCSGIELYGVLIQTELGRRASLEGIRRASILLSELK